MEIESRIGSIKEMFDGKTCYTVPSYQNRAYDLLNGDFYRLIDTIIGSYEKENDKPCFLGTVVLSGKNEIIDGQKRILTLSIFLKELSFLFPKNEKIKEIKFDFLKTKAFNGCEKERFSKYFLSEKRSETKDEGWNELPCVIRNKIEGLFQGKNKTDSKKFIDYLFEKVIFNIVKVSGLSFLDSLSMFQDINTSLNPSSVLDKFRKTLFNELSYKNGMKEEDAIKETSSLFLYADKVFSSYGEFVSDMKDFLQKLKMIFYSQYNLPFFSFWSEDLYFPSDMKKLDLSKIKRVMDIDLDCHKKLSLHPNKEKFLYDAFINNRFGTYFDKYDPCIPYLFFHKDDYEGLYRFLDELYKLFFVYFICFCSENYMDGFISSLLKEIRGTNESLCKIIFKYKEREKKRFKEKIKSPVEEKQKETLCVLFEFIKMKKERNLKEWKSFLKRDSEFIKIHENLSGDFDWEDTALERGNGNMLLIESDLMEKAKGKTFLEKKEIFKKSKFYTAHSLSNLSQDDWKENDAKKRMNEITEEIFNYIYS